MTKWLKILALAMQWAAIQTTKTQDQKQRKEDKLLQEIWETGRRIFSPAVTQTEKAVENAETLGDLLLDDDDSDNMTAFLKEGHKEKENGKNFKG